MSFAPKATRKIAVALDKTADRIPAIGIRGNTVLWFFVIYGYFMLALYIYTFFAALFMAVWIAQVLVWIVAAPFKIFKKGK